MDNGKKEFMVNFLVILITLIVMHLQGYFENMNSASWTGGMTISLRGFALIISIAIFTNLVLGVIFSEKISTNIANIIWYSVLGVFIFYCTLRIEESMLNSKTHETYEKAGNYVKVYNIDSILKASKIYEKYETLYGMDTGNDNIKVFKVLYSKGEVSKFPYVYSDLAKYILLIDVPNNKIMQAVFVDSLLQSMNIKYDLKNKEVNMTDYSTEDKIKLSFDWNDKDKRRTYIIEISYDKGKGNIQTNIDQSEIDRTREYKQELEYQAIEEILMSNNIGDKIYSESTYHNTKDNNIKIWVTYFTPEERNGIAQNNGNLKLDENLFKRIVFMDLKNKKMLQVINTEEYIEKAIKKFNLQGKMLEIKSELGNIDIFSNEDIAQKTYRIEFKYDERKKKIIPNMKEYVIGETSTNLEN